MMTNSSFIIAMFPDLFGIGFLHIKTYGACMAIGFLVCWKLVERLSGRQDLGNLIMALMVAGVCGSRAAYVIENWRAEFAANPMGVIRVDQGGLVFYGGLILAIIVYFAWCIAKKENIARLSDLLTTVIPLGHAFGRIGCFFYGCCYGRISESPLAVCFPFRSPAWHAQFAAGLIPPEAKCSLPVLPTQLFEAAALLSLFSLLLFLYKRQSMNTSRQVPGMVTGVYMICYSLIRFALEYMRGDPRAAVGPFSIAQTISFGIFALGVAFLVAPRILVARRNGRE